MRSLLLCLLISISSVAHAGYFSGNDMVKWADANDRVLAGRGAGYDEGHSAMIGAYVAGVYDAYKLGGGMCVPQKTPLGQLIAVVKKHLKDHPSEWHFTAEAIVIVALINAFPCSEK